MSDRIAGKSNLWDGIVAPAIFFILCLGIALNFQSIATDIDDVVRELQIRDLLADGNWHDMQLPFIAMPEAYYSHYSRLVDAPYYFITVILTPFLGADSAFAVSKSVIPLSLLAIFSVSFYNVTRYLCGGRVPLFAILIAPILIFFALFNFSPNRIDHHNFQLVAMMVLCWGLLKPDRSGGYLIGAASLISVIIGLECLPFIIIAYAGLILASVYGDETSLSKLNAAGMVLLGSAIPFGLLLLGLTGASSVQCDAYSLPWIFGATLGGAVLIALGKLWAASWFSMERKRTHRIFSLFLIGIPLGVTMALLFPACLEGPYHMIDPISREYWLERLVPEKPIFVTLATAPTAFVIYCLLFVFLAAFTLVGCVEDIKSGKYGTGIVAIIALSALAITLVQMRFLKFSMLFLTLFFAKIYLDALTTVRSPSARKKLFNYKILPAVLIPVAFLTVLFSYKKTSYTVKKWNAYDSMISNDCKMADFSILESVEPGRIIAPLGLSLNLLDKNYGHQLAATVHHRSSPGIRNVLQVFTTTDATLRNSILMNFDYVAVCAWADEQNRSSDFYDTSSAPLYLSLTADLEWPGLSVLTTDSKQKFRLYRIEKSIR